MTTIDPWRIVKVVDVIMDAGGNRVVTTTVGLHLLRSLQRKMTITAAAVVEVAAAAAEEGIKIIHRSSRAAAGTVDVVVIAVVVAAFVEAGDSLAEGVVVVEAHLHRSSGTTAEVLLLHRSGTTAEVLLLHLSIGMMVGALLLVEGLLHHRSSGTTDEAVAVVAAAITMNVNDTETIVTLVIRGRDDRAARMNLIHTVVSKC
jgi:predicted dinucleotide-binding enzyme